MIKDIIILLLVGYLIYKLFSRFVLPIVRMTSVANDHMNRMQEQMKEMDRKMKEQAQGPKIKSKGQKDGDYIEYEEM